MTSRFWLLIGAIYGLLFLGMAGLHGMDILLAVPLLVYLGAAVLAAPEKTRFAAQRQVGAHTVEQDVLLPIQVSLTNEGAGADELFVQDFPPQTIRGLQGRTNLLAPLKSGETVGLDYSIRPGRGSMAFETTQVIIGEHFGLFQRKADLPTPGNILALPGSHYLHSLAIRPQHTRGFSGPIPSRQKGSGMSFWGVREYQTGDSLRRINWKVSARHSRDLFTNEFEQERIADVGLILDAREQSNPTVNSQEIFEHAVQATAALAEAFLADGHRVSLLIYGYGMTRVFPGYGKVQRGLILQALAKAEPGSNYALESLNNLPTRLFPARSQLVMISTLGQRDLPAFSRLRKDGYEVLLVSPDPVSFEARWLADRPQMQAALRLARLERDLLLRKLNRLGVLVVDWPVDQPLDRTIQVVLSRNRLFHRNLKAISSR